MSATALESPIKSPSPEKLKRPISTPYLLRKLKQTKYAHTMPAQKYDSEESGESSSDSGSSSDDVEETSDHELSVGQRQKVVELDVAANKENVESYFQSRKGAKTSNKTLNDLNLEELEHSEICKILAKNKTDPFYKERIALNAEHKQAFKQWKCYIQEGFNVLLYGLGSKRNILLDFSKRLLKNDYHVMINGYFPNLTVKNILNTVTNDLMGSSATFKSVHDQLNYIANSKYNDIYILINNIDGANLRNEKSQEVLAKLAAIEHVFVIATIDHIHAPLLWDEDKAKLFNWIWIDCTSFEPYTDETSFETALMVNQTGALALSSMTHVLRSLTPNARGIFKLLAVFQQGSGDEFQGISFQEFYLKCREKFLVNSDATLRAQLTEFKDHMLIKTRTVEGSEVLYIPIELSILKQFIESDFFKQI